MNQNYPEYILEILRERRGLEEDDKSIDEELQEMSPEEAFDEVVEWEGLCGYSYWLLQCIQDIFKVKLSSNGDEQSKQEFVQGLGNIFKAQDMDEVVAMRMDENEVVTVHFQGGGTHRAHCEMDSKRATISDILRQAF